MVFVSLYDIGNTYKELLEAIASGEIPEEAIADTLAAVDGEFTDKADNIACFIKSLLAEKQAIKAEIDVLNERAEAKQHKADKLTDYLYQMFKLSGKTKIETARNVMSIRKTPPKVEVDDDTAFIAYAREHGDELFLTIKDPTINKTKLKEYLKAGNEYPHAKLVAGEKLSIK
jgi:phage host-nuclease inhibitor protein Gam